MSRSIKAAKLGGYPSNSRGFFFDDGVLVRSIGASLYVTLMTGWCFDVGGGSGIAIGGGVGGGVGGISTVLALSSLSVIVSDVIGLGKTIISK